MSYDGLIHPSQDCPERIASLEKEIAALRAENERLKAPVSDEEIHIFYSGECEAGVSFDFLRRFQNYIFCRFNGAARASSATLPKENQ